MRFVDTLGIALICGMFLVASVRMAANRYYENAEEQRIQTANERVAAQVEAVRLSLLAGNRE